jgi:hypothetical protein
MNPIEAAVAPLKDQAIARAEQDASAIVARRLKALEEAGWDLDVAAPYPNSRKHGDREYKTMLRYRESLESVSRTYIDPEASPYHYRRRGEPLIVEADLAKIDRFIELSKKMAADQYILFVMKLCKKIGDCDSAALEGSHVWGHSILTVAKGDKIERWKTQQIVNCSVHGLLFNQWPTRKVK